MHNLYYVACYSQRNNDWARYLSTAKDEDEAKYRCEYGDYKAKRVEFVCVTPDEVSKEV